MRALKLMLVGTIALLLAACASTQMTEVSEAQLVKKPDPGKALVYFLRPSSFGAAIQATLYDDTQYIGAISYNTCIAYQATPGRHVFMVVGESADFLQADLLADKTYYAEVAPRLGVWKARFSFRPQNGQIPKSEVNGWVASSRQVVPNEEGYKSAHDNEADIKAKKAEYLPKWQDKQDKQTLNAASGE